MEESSNRRGTNAAHSQAVVRSLMGRLVESKKAKSNVVLVNACATAYTRGDLRKGTGFNSGSKRNSRCQSELNELHCKS